MPAGLPWGMPGMGEAIEGAMQQAAQPGRQSIGGLVAGAGILTDRDLRDDSTFNLCNGKVK